MNLEQYRLPLKEPQWQLDRLIGRKEICAWLRGQIGFKTKSLAYLFAGKEGNGKRTADNALAWYFYQTAANQETAGFAYYQIPLERFSAKNREETAAQLETVFGEIQKLFQKEQNQSRVIYISFGNLWSLLKYKKTARVLLEGVENLLKDARIRSEKYPVCLTGYCHKESSRLPYEVYSVFRTVELPFPDEAQRQEYFDFVQNRSQWCGWKVSSKNLAEKTEHFTFLMLESFAESVLAWASGTLRSQAEKEFRSLQEHISVDMISWADQKVLEQQSSKTAVIIIPEQVIAFWLELIGKRRKAPEAPAVQTGIPAVYPAYAMPAASDVQNVPQEQPVPEADSDDIKKREAQIQNKINQADSFEELESIMESSYYEDIDEELEELDI